MNKVKIALASAVIAGSMIAGAAPAVAAPVDPALINSCKNLPAGSTAQVRARLSCYMSLLTIKYPNLLNIRR